MKINYAKMQKFHSFSEFTVYHLKKSITYLAMCCLTLGFDLWASENISISIL